jgi:anaerobic selenocysteine-containing dehydrogenase
MATTATTHYRSCTLCEAGCGVAVTVEGGRITSAPFCDDQPPATAGGSD